MITNLIKPHMGKRILNQFIGNICPELCNGLLKQLLYQTVSGTLFRDSCFQNHPDSVLLEKYQSRSNQGFEHNSADMQSENLTPNFSFEPRFCMFNINGYYTKSKRLQSLDLFFYLCSGDFPFKLCHHIIIIKEFLLGSCINIFTKVVCSLIKPVPSRKIWKDLFQ